MIILIKKKSTTNSNYSELYGSLFNEFKNNKGLLSSIFYVLFFIRRLCYALTQLLLSDFPIFQMISLIVFSILQFGYILYYRPFKDIVALTCEFLGEICVLVTFILSFTTLFIFDKNTEVKIENAIRLNIVAGICIQILLCVYSLARSMLELYRSFKNNGHHVAESTQVIPCDLRIDSISIHSEGIPAVSCKNN